MINTQAQPSMRHGLLAWPIFVTVLLALAQTAAAQSPAPGAESAPAPAPAAPIAAPAPGSAPLAQPAPQPYYGQQPYAGQPYAGQPYAGQPYAQPVYAPNYPPPRPAPYRPSRALLIAGVAMFGASYLVTALSGAVLMDIDHDSCDKCKNVAPLLFIPIAGPFVALPVAKTGHAFLVISGLVQIGGVALTVVGAIQYAAGKRRAEQGMYSMTLPKGRSLSLDLSASPLRLGPEARLRF